MTFGDLLIAQSRLVRQEKQSAENFVAQSLLTKLHGCIPRSDITYNCCLQNYITKFENENEWLFLKNLLQFMKIKLKAKKLSVNSFTVFEKTKKLPVPVLKSKFFALIGQFDKK